MLSRTLQEGLDAYAIGARVRALRLRKKMGLVELGRHTGLSPGLLSKIERGRQVPTLPTLLRIALVFSVGLEYFFAGPREQPLVARAPRRSRVRLPERPDGRDAAYSFESLDYAATERHFNGYYAEFLPVAPEKRRPHAHPGAELIYVITGSLMLELDGKQHVLGPGDAIYFDSSVPHSYGRAGTRRCAAVVITAP